MVLVLVCGMKNICFGVVPIASMQIDLLRSYYNAQQSHIKNQLFTFYIFDGDNALYSHLKKYEKPYSI